MNKAILVSVSDKFCEFCGKVLHGRSDQRFCNDTCRNTFNRKSKAEMRMAEHENIPEIIRVIKKNYQILKHFTLERSSSGKAYLSTDDFLLMNVNQKYFTSIFTAEDGVQWNCVFECCYRVDGSSAFIKEIPQQVEI
jgi:predicted nucleic acid-binding Zn ribbon protein